MGNLGKIIVATGFESCSKYNKLPNLVTLVLTHTREGASKCAEKKNILLPSFERNVIKSLFPQKLLNYSILFATQLASMEAKSTAESLIETSLFEPVFQ